MYLHRRPVSHLSCLNENRSITYFTFRKSESQIRAGTEQIKKIKEVKTK